MHTHNYFQTPLSSNLFHYCSDCSLKHSGPPIQKIIHVQVTWDSTQKKLFKIENYEELVGQKQDFICNDPVVLLFSLIDCLNSTNIHRS